ncbi:MAG: hypothetical protein R3277_12595 [Brumimicrobium sp.]|nr:hypothetical protein [Brumimicrobium sp.]
MGNLIAPVLFFAAALFMHQRLEFLGLEIGLTFTYAKILPYLIELALLSWLLFGIHKVFLQKYTRMVKRIFIILILIAGAGIAFVSNPIYEGDFTHSYRTVTLSEEKAEMYNEGLTMFALPGCPYCMDQIGTFNRIYKHFPSLQLNVIITSRDSSALNTYRKELPGEVEVSFSGDLGAMDAVIGGRYPSFIYKDSPETREVFHWHSNDFGVAAIDWMIDQNKH